MNWKTAPKIELHLHIDCSLSYKFVSGIDPSISPEQYQRDFVGPVRCANLQEYLRLAERGVRLMQTEDQLEGATLDVFEQLQADAAIYAELRFAPLLHTRKGLKPEEAVAAVCRAIGKGVERTGVEARLILCTLRHFSEGESLQTVQLARQFIGQYVAGFDIAGDEAGYPLDAHRAAFSYARRHGIACTAHAGEARGPKSVWETLESLSPDRIGHGVRSIEDPRLLAHLKKLQIHLEVCPSSNLKTNMYEEIASHPVDRLYQEGLSVGINTDGRTISNVALTEEYNKLAAAFGWSARHFLACNLRALEAAFVDEQTKDRLRHRLESAYLKLL